MLEDAGAAWRAAGKDQAALLQQPAGLAGLLCPSAQNACGAEVPTEDTAADEVLLQTLRSNPGFTPAPAHPRLKAWQALIRDCPFAGLMTWHSRCVRCGHRSECQLSLLAMLQLPVRASPGRASIVGNRRCDGLSLADCLCDFGAPELVREARCDACASAAGGPGLRGRIRWPCWARLPPRMLCVALQRSAWSATGHPLKIEGHIAFPEELSESSLTREIPWWSEQREARGAARGLVNDVPETPAQTPMHAPYQLVAVACHLGVATSGHWVVHRRLRAQLGVDAWVTASDGQVCRTTLPCVLASEASIIYYERRA